MRISRRLMTVLLAMVLTMAAGTALWAKAGDIKAKMRGFIGSPIALPAELGANAGNRALGFRVEATLRAPGAEGLMATFTTINPAGSLGSAMVTAGVATVRAQPTAVLVPGSSVTATTSAGSLTATF